MWTFKPSEEVHLAGTGWSRETPISCVWKHHSITGVFLGLGDVQAFWHLDMCCWWRNTSIHSPLMDRLISNKSLSTIVNITALCQQMLFERNEMKWNELMVAYRGCVKILVENYKNICYIKGCDISVWVYYRTHLFQRDTVETKYGGTIKAKGFFLFFVCDVGWKTMTVPWHSPRIRNLHFTSLNYNTNILSYISCLTSSSVLESKWEPDFLTLDLHIEKKERWFLSRYHIYIPIYLWYTIYLISPILWLKTILLAPLNTAPL